MFWQVLDDLINAALRRWHAAIRARRPGFKAGFALMGLAHVLASMAAGTRTVTTTAGALARTLIRREMVASPNGTPKSSSNAGAETSGNRTTFYAAGLAGNKNLSNVKDASPELVRSVEFAHEGLHGQGTRMDNSMAGFNYNWLVANPGFHQDAYNKAAYDALYVDP